MLGRTPNILISPFYALYCKLKFYVRFREKLDKFKKKIIILKVCTYLSDNYAKKRNARDTWEAKWIQSIFAIASDETLKIEISWLCLFRFFRRWDLSNCSSLLCTVDPIWVKWFLSNKSMENNNWSRRAHRHFSHWGPYMMACLPSFYHLIRNDNFEIAFFIHIKIKKQQLFKLIWLK